MEIIIDFGNIWEMLSAIGTIAAVIVSLYLSRKENTPIIDVDVYGINEPVNIVSQNSLYFEENPRVVKVIDFEIKNHSNYEVEISGIKLAFIKKKRLLKIMQHNKWVLTKIKTKEVYAVMNDPDLGLFSKLPLKIEAKKKETFMYGVDNFRKLLDEENKDRDVLVMVFDSFGNYTYKYIEVK